MAGDEIEELVALAAREVQAILTLVDAVQLLEQSAPLRPSSSSCLRLPFGPARAARASPALGGFGMMTPCRPAPAASTPTPRGTRHGRLCHPPSLGPTRP